jgi:hypothetical protein
MKASLLFMIFSTLLISNGEMRNALALEPSTIQERDNVRWSQVVQDPFDGQTVYDKDFNPYSVLVSTWSPKAIRVTFIQRNDIIVGYHQVPKYSTYADGSLKVDYVNEPITKDRVEIPKELRFVIHEKPYIYTDGEVSPELAQALINAPSGDMVIRAIWQNGTNYNMRIGSGTVAAWKTVFQGVLQNKVTPSSSPEANSQPSKIN